jgi:hypothetical protein
MMGVLAAGLACAGIALGARTYADAHEKAFPLRLPAGTEEIRSQNEQARVFMVPNSAVDELECGSVERPIVSDSHNPKRVIGRLGDRAIVQCVIRSDVPIVR